MKRSLLLLTVVVSGCAVAPEHAPATSPTPAAAPARPPVMDGGIVGTGNQIDCEPRKEKDGTAAPLPDECRR